MKVTECGTKLVTVSRFHNYIKFVLLGMIGHLGHLKFRDTDCLMDRTELDALMQKLHEMLAKTDERYEEIKANSKKT